jgi:hypothetical protein
MQNVATQVMVTVNAPYGAELSAHQLAAMLVDPNSVAQFNAPVFAFFSELAVDVQKQFIAAMGVSEVQAAKVAGLYAQASGYTLPLAA